MARAQAIIDLIANDRRFKAAMTRVHGILLKVKTAMRGVAQTARRMLFFGTAALVGFVKATSDQIKAEIKLASVLKTTGNAAGFTAKQLGEQARELQKLTGVGDEVILNAQAILATFKQIQGVQFTRAIKSILDMSAVLDQDLKSGAIQVGKALNDPIKGITALSRVGVSFTQQQKDMIAAFVQSGNVAAAQGVILDELEGEFGGVAKAIGDSLPGALKKAWAALGDMGEQIGSIFVPFITAVTQKIVEVTQKIVDWALANQQFVKRSAAVLTVLAALVAIIPTISVALIGLSSSLTVLGTLAPLLTVTAGVIVATAAAVLLLTKRIHEFNNEPKLMEKSLNEATTALNNASAAAKKLNDALGKGKYEEALEAAAERSKALQAALDDVRKEAEKVREEMASGSMVSNDAELAARLINLNQQAFRLQQQINEAKDKEEKIQATITRHAEAAARRASERAKLEKEAAEREAKQKEELEKNESLLEQIKEVQDEIAVLNGKISSEQAEINRLTAKGEDIATAARLVGLKALRDEMLKRKEKEQALKDEANSIRESLMSEKERLRVEIDRVNQIAQAGLLTKAEASAKITALRKEFEERQRIADLLGTIQTSEALFRRTQEAAGARKITSPQRLPAIDTSGLEQVASQITDQVQKLAGSKDNSGQQALLKLSERIENVMKVNNKKQDETTFAVQQFQALFEKVADESTVIGRFGR